MSIADAVCPSTVQAANASDAEDLSSLLLPVYVGNTPLVIPLPLHLVGSSSKTASNNLKQYLASFCASHALPAMTCDVVYDALIQSWDSLLKEDVSTTFFFLHVRENATSWQWIRMPIQSLANRICIYMATQANQPHVLDQMNCVSMLEMAFSSWAATKRTVGCPHKRSSVILTKHNTVTAAPNLVGHVQVQHEDLYFVIVMQ
jgi:hypothetical protein